MARKARKTRWSSGICTLCGERFECITFAHAEKHGFSHPDEMAKSKIVRWDNFTVGKAYTKSESEIERLKVGVNRVIQGSRI